MCFNAAKS
jgi:hypothetical protein